MTNIYESHIEEFSIEILKTQDLHLFRMSSNGS